MFAGRWGRSHWKFCKFKNFASQKLPEREKKKENSWIHFGLISVFRKHREKDTRKTFIRHIHTRCSITRTSCCREDFPTPTASHPEPTLKIHAKMSSKPLGRFSNQRTKPILTSVRCINWEKENKKWCNNVIFPKKNIENIS